MHPFCYLTGEQEKIGGGSAFTIPFSKFNESLPDEFEGDDPERLMALNRFWTGIANSAAPFSSSEDAYQWLYDHLVDYVPFCEMFKRCRGTAASLQELAESIFQTIIRKTPFKLSVSCLQLHPWHEAKVAACYFRRECTCSSEESKVCMLAQIPSVLIPAQKMV